jgi:pyridinium-3,5-bisthiocarboxylic acid mononucleotide nickel chelatase
MTTIAFFECFSGAAGDMIVAACLDAGVPQDYLLQELAKLGLAEDAEFNITRVKRAGISATAFVPAAKSRPHQPDGHSAGQDARSDAEMVHGEHGAHSGQPAASAQHHQHGYPGCRNLSAILGIIQGAGLREPVKKQAGRIFQTLAEAEANVHGTSLDQVHFHEVGGFDAIVDIVGACVAFDYLGIDRFYCSPLVVGSGTVRCRHGVMPVPAPATAEMIKGIDIISTGIRKELLTPTGAAVLTTVAEGFGPMPDCRIASIGYGAGTHDFPDFPNVVRMFVGTACCGLRPVGGAH